MVKVLGPPEALCQPPSLLGPQGQALSLVPREHSGFVE